MWQRTLSTPAWVIMCENEQCPPIDLLGEEREGGKRERGGRERERERGTEREER